MANLNIDIKKIDEQIFKIKFPKIRMKWIEKKNQIIIFKHETFLTWNDVENSIY